MTPSLAWYLLRVVAAGLTHSRRVAPRRPRPFLANLNLTENCNARCVTCDYWRDRRTDGISTERAKDLIGECARAGIKALRFTGGEPLVRRDLFDILKAVRPGQFQKVVLATNGLLLGHHADAINASAITNVTVSLDAMEERNDRIRGVDGYFRKALANLERVRKPVKIVSTLTTELQPDLPELLNLCRARGWRYDVNLLDSNLYFFASDEVAGAVKRLTPSQSQAIETLGLLEKEGLLAGCILASAKHFIRHGRFDFQHCMQGFIEVNIDSAGGVRTGCNVFAPVGDITSAKLEDIVASAAYRDSVAKMFAFDCPGCTCGYGISSALCRPFAAGLAYVVKRLT